ncbi:hypothetical protein [Actinomadura opuntiae]|uniref:hypothetical protein n=1 Tax=Actinomadura sp. OS1-43 TaxID=604315 RepID=UPI00255AE3A0|nr:hypothetical protein [Actinomadura sp. OS1-43]MDL4812670.1 hypothetical protein [Actinomadura sp. OS1-43]
MSPRTRARSASGTGHGPVPGSAVRGRAETGRWAAFWLLVLIEFMTMLDTSIVNVALPSIQRDLRFSTAGPAWVVDGYLLGGRPKGKCYLVRHRDADRPNEILQADHIVAPRC